MGTERAQSATREDAHVSAEKEAGEAATPEEFPSRHGVASELSYEGQSPPVLFQAGIEDTFAGPFLEGVVVTQTTTGVLDLPCDGAKCLADVCGYNRVCSEEDTFVRCKGELKPLCEEGLEG